MMRSVNITIIVIVHRENKPVKLITVAVYSSSELAYNQDYTQIDDKTLQLYTVVLSQEIENLCLLCNTILRKTK